MFTGEIIGGEVGELHFGSSCCCCFPPVRVRAPGPAALCEHLQGTPPAARLFRQDPRNVCKMHIYAIQKKGCHNHLVRTIYSLYTINVRLQLAFA